jgi:hypothetical protein
MFGLPSLTKLLVLAGVILAVWYGFKLVGRMDSARKAEAKLREGQGKAPKKSTKPEKTEDMVQCPVCGVYVPAKSAQSCGKPNCPY